MGKLKSILRLKAILKKYRIVIAAGLAGALLSSLLSTPVPYVIGHLLDKVLMGSKSYQRLYFYIGIIALLYISQYIVSLVSKNLFVRVNNATVNQLRYAVMDKMLNMPMSYLAATEKGYIQGRLAECNTVGSLFSPAIVSIFLGLISAVLAIISMFIINYKMTFIVLVLTPVFFFTSKASTKGFMKNTKNLMESSAVLSGESFEILNGIEEIKILNGKQKQLQKFKNKMDELIKFSIKQSRSMIMLLENINLLNEAGNLIILLVSGIFILRGEFTIGLYTSFSLYIARVFGCTQGLATLSTTLKPVFLSIERIFELLDMEDENSGRDIKLEGEVERIEFRQAGFHYKEDLADVFENLNFSIEKGSRILLQGDNGSGKTTLIKLLLGLYQPTSGELLINGINASGINCDSIRQHFGIVSQNVFLFRGSVLENILYGQEVKGRGDVEDLISAMGLEDYIKRLPGGLDTDISQNTAGISGGQAQIIAFIRAILSEKDVIILDEPISNVDAETRTVVIDILKNYTFHGILLVISHQTEGFDFFTKVERLGKAAK